MEIKEQSENGRMAWIRSFEEAVPEKKFNALAPQRKAYEQYLQTHLTNMRRLVAQGDARELLTAVNNYLQIQMQYARSVMETAEALDGNNPEAIAKIQEQTNEFSKKEKIFLLEINNALATSGQDYTPVAAPVTNEDEAEEKAFEEPRGSVMEGRPERKRKKLPHEMTEEEEAGEETAPAKEKQKSRKGKKTETRVEAEDED